MKKCLKCNSLIDQSGFTCPECGHTFSIVHGIKSFAPDFCMGDPGFHPEAFEKLFAAEADNFWFRSRNQLILWAMNKFFPNAATMLEIGCGTGYVLSGIAQHRPAMALSGSEIFSEGLRFAKGRIRREVNLYQMDARAIPFENEFDLVGAFDVLEHIKEDEDVLRQMHQATTPGGVLITVPQHEWMWSEIDAISMHQRRYTARDLKTKMQRAGFACEYMTSFVSLLLPLMYLSRIKKTGNQGVDEMDQLNLPGWLNRSFETIMNLERALIKAGWRLPIGGSLMAVGKALK
jgi:SAM-dependent methyltransferase